MVTHLELNEQYFVCRYIPQTKRESEFGHALKASLSVKSKALLFTFNSSVAILLYNFVLNNDFQSAILFNNLYFLLCILLGF